MTAAKPIAHPLSMPRVVSILAVLLVALLATGPVAARPVPDSFRVLTDSDVALYRDIFAAQARGDMKAADAAIAKLGNPVLMGHVLFERYLHPTAWRATPQELSAWMERYGDHPGADRLYTLARKRAGAGVAAPLEAKRRPINEDVPNEMRLTARAARMEMKVIGLIRDDRPTQALRMIDDERARGRLDPAEYDALRQRIAWSYYIERKDDKAFAIAGDVAGAGRRDLPLADWVAGLSAYRLGRYSEAAGFFESLAGADVSGWTRSAGAFWAARANLLAQRPERLTTLLEQAARIPDTFYGLLALRVLGRDLPFQWKTNAPSAREIAALRGADAAIDRGIALVQVDRDALAFDEFFAALGRLPITHDTAFAALGEALELPGLSMKVAQSTGNPYGMIDALFPVLGPSTRRTLNLDPALVHAFVRAESKFDIRAQSPAGATGLMQIMPATARHLSGSSDPDQLLDPMTNLRLGQQYLREVMAFGNPRGNILMLATAYNGGPGNLGRWLEEMDYRADPLLYAESIPARETRTYLERVMTNLWIYEHRFSGTTHGVDEMAAGAWPVYRGTGAP
ncbi:MAG: transglycosylase SLT domain-containing protein [Alphaproteobacteria bacterium]|nr:transglycosylase SLT domain-containing protein [Alphaproteobacteria bacterium]